MSVDIVRATVRDACFVAANMREADRREIGAVVSMDQPALVALALLDASGDMAFVARRRGQPIAAFGVSPVFPHIWTGWAYGTEWMPRAVPAMTDHIMGVITPAMVDRDVRRVEVRTMADHDISHRWLASMGARLETPEPYVFGRHGERFVTYGWGR